MTVVNLNLRIGSVTYNNGKVGGTGIPDPSAGHEYVKIEVEDVGGTKQIVASSGSNNARITNLKPSAAAAAAPQNTNTITHVFLEVPETDSETVALLIRLKKIIAAQTGALQTEPWVMIKIDDGKLSRHHTNDSELLIKEVSIDDIDINVNDNSSTAGNPKLHGTDGGARLGNDLSLWRSKLIEVSKLMKKGYNDYKSLPSVDDDLKILRHFLDATNAPTKNNLDASAHTKTAVEADDGKKIYQTIGKLAVDKANTPAETTYNYTQAAAELLQKRLQELKIAKETIGLSSIDELLKFNAAGFTIHGNNRDGATNGSLNAANPLVFGTQNAPGTAPNKTVKDNFPNPDKKYRGCDVLALIDAEGKITLEDDSGADDDAHIFGRKVNVNGTKITKGHIDAVRNVEVTATTTNAAQNNSPEKLALFANFKDKIDSKDLWGYELGDITGNNGSGYIGGNTTNVTVWETLFTKSEVDINAAANKKALTERAFLEPNFQEVNSGYIPKVDATKADYKTAVDANVTSKTYCANALDILDRHIFLVRKNSNNIWKHDGADANKPLASDDNTTKLEEEFTEMKELVRIMLVENYSGNKAKAQADKPKLGAYKNPTAGSVQHRLKGAKILKELVSGETLLTIKLREIDAAITGTPPPADGLTAANQKELTGKINDANLKDPAKKVYQAFDNLNDKTKKKDSVYTALKSLIEKLTDKSSWEDTPRTLKTDFASGDNKTAWEFVNEETKNDNDWKTDGWAEKVSKEAVAKLTSAISAAETVMSSETGAKDKILADINSIKLAKEIKTLFEICIRAYGNPSTSETGNIKNDLEGYTKNDASIEKKDAWKAVNNYIKSGGSTKGYAQGALDKVKNSDDNNKKSFADLLKLADPKAIREEGIKGKLEKKLYQRAQIAKKFENSNDAKEKLLADIFKKGGSTTDYSDDEAKLDENMKKITEHIEALEKIIGATDKTSAEGKIMEEIKKIDSDLATDAKSVLEDWLSQLKVREGQLKSKKDSNQQNTGGGGKTPEEPSWYGTWWGILLIITAVVVVLAGIAWLIKSNSSEEGEGESE